MRTPSIYFTDAVCITDHKEAALATHANGGKVIVAVARIIPTDRDMISIPVEYVTAIIVNPWSEQTGGIRQNKCLPMLTAGGNEDIQRGINKLRMINHIVGITSKRGEGVRNYIGPGGLINIAESAQTIIFVGHWMANGQYRVQNGALSIKKRGKVKFVDKVDEVTFCARRALNSGRKVFYVTTVGVFQLTTDGLQIVYVVPGVDIEKDIVQTSTAKFILPKDNDVSQVPTPVVTGHNFTLTPKNKTH